MNRSFARWASRERISSAALIQAVTEMEAGLIDARLGAGLYKKRIGLPGRAGASGEAHELLTYSPARIGMALRHGAIIEVENDG
ncbi:type II toxin-antitoxin system RelE/ParE family toxin [Alloalcanivorax marinus]|uniref:type II toxin-antitoxin system RelE/ParE family toxin n=1 Tax=Alloalcanivorax marinus TaxID=1177169 RepID=UPI0019331E56|nr:type II toxin-antitoxin system RelE/ParE family toxin [Alloalcanivorax marinus]MBL7250224.1 type II toxin-antitoxin system RelE/ParE family toxin [Alloalcanivorax marinus]